MKDPWWADWKVTQNISLQSNYNKRGSTTIHIQMILMLHGLGTWALIFIWSPPASFSGWPLTSPRTLGVTLSEIRNLLEADDQCSDAIVNESRKLTLQMRLKWIISYLKVQKYRQHQWTVTQGKRKVVSSNSKNSRNWKFQPHCIPKSDNITRMANFQEIFDLMVMYYNNKNEKEIGRNLSVSTKVNLKRVNIIFKSQRWHCI